MQENTTKILQSRQIYQKIAASQVCKMPDIKLLCDYIRHFSIVKEWLEFVFKIVQSHDI